MAILSKEIQNKIKRKWFSEGQALDTDRSKQAQKTFSITDVKEFDKWKKNHSRSDLRGFDTPEVKETSIRQVIRKITNRASGEEVLVNEPDRFVDSNTEAGRMLAKYKDSVTDFESFKEIVKKAWGKDGDSIKNLYDSISHNRIDGVLKSLFDSSIVQGWLKHNKKDDMIKYIMKKYSVEKKRATSVFNRLSPQSRTRLLNTITNKQPKIIKTKEKIVKTSVVNLIKQKSRLGKVYKRTKPIRWDRNQIRFLQARRDKPLERILEQYNTFFEKRRTIGSLRNKINRL